MNVRVDLESPIRDGMEVVFKAPCDASEVTGLNVYYPVDGVLESQNFVFADANAKDLGHLDALFARDAVVKVILDLDTNRAFVQNADTNAYLESRLAKVSVDDSNIGSNPWSSKNTVDKLCPSFTESGSVIACEPIEGYPLDVVFWQKNLIGVTTDDLISGCWSDDTGDSIVDSTYLCAIPEKTVEPNTVYTLSSDMPMYNIWFVSSSTGAKERLSCNDFSVITFTTPPGCDRIRITIMSPHNVGADSMWIQLEKGSIATKYEPHKPATIVTRCGKNLLNEDWKDWNNYVSNKLVLNLPKGRYTASATKKTENVYFYLYKSTDGGATWTIYGKLITNLSTTTTTFDVTGADGEKWSLGTSSSTYQLGVETAQIELGNTATAYEPYYEETFAVGEPILGLSGVNTIYADSGNVTVSGKADPTAIIEKLTNAIISLGGNV